MKFTSTSNLGKEFPQNKNLLNTPALQEVSAWVFSPCPTEHSYRCYQNDQCKAKGPPLPQWRPNSSCPSISFRTSPVESSTLTPTYPNSPVALGTSVPSRKIQSPLQSLHPRLHHRRSQLRDVALYHLQQSSLALTAMDQTALEMLNFSASSPGISSSFHYFPHFSFSEEK